jgi:Zn-finger nucleic acid-binding protein
MPSGIERYRRSVPSKQKCPKCGHRLRSVTSYNIFGDAESYDKCPKCGGV